MERKVLWLCRENWVVFKSLFALPIQAAHVTRDGRLLAALLEHPIPSGLDRATTSALLKTLENDNVWLCCKDRGSSGW